MADIVPALNELIESTFQTKMVTDRRIARISKRIRDGTATLVDAHRYAQYTGEALSKALVQNITADSLPDGKLYYNIAKRTVTPALKECHVIVNDVSAQIQEIVDKKAGIGLKALKADFPDKRINGLVDKLTSYDEFEKASVWLKEPIVNNVESFFDDYVKTNVDFRYKSGLKETIERIAEPNCCEWCAERAGTYEYGYSDTMPDGIFQRHEFCRCDVTYKSEKKFQNVWTKESWKPTEEELAARKETQMPKVSISQAMEKYKVTKRG